MGRHADLRPTAQASAQDAEGHALQPIAHRKEGQRGQEAARGLRDHAVLGYRYPKEKETT